MGAAMSGKKWDYLHFLSDEEKATLDAHDQQILWLKVRLSWHDRHRYEIVNRGTQRARLEEAKRRIKDPERREGHATWTH
jgi:hypothetical protein